jgi:diguanylate cyclase (GGDEF)-like protein/PAS domain S-box-containing protein
LHQHLRLVQQVVDAAFSDSSANKLTKLTADYWRWHDEGGIQRPAQLHTPQLQADWEQLGKLHEQFLQAATAALKAAAKGDKARARDQLNEMFEHSGELTQLVVGASLHELTAAFLAREQDFAARYERDLLEAAHIGRFAVRLSDNILIDADDNFLAFLGFDRTQFLGINADRVFDGKTFQRLIKAATSEVPNARTQLKLKNNQGRRVTLEVIAHIEEKGGGEILRCLAANISQNEADAQQRRLLSTAIEVSNHVVMITNARQEIVYVNPAFTRLTGYDVSEALGKNPRFLQGRETNQATRIALREALAEGRNVHVEVLNYTKEGLRYWVDLSIVPVTDDSGEITHFIAVEHDITERKAAELEIVRIALSDHLTGLSNRHAAEERLATEWQRARRGSGSFALALLDIDRFKLVNDQYGHHIGDLALKHVADTIARNLRGGDWVARWGGEEFLLCLHDMDSRGAHIGAERIRKQIKSNPLKIPLGELPLTVSIGVSLYSPEHEDIDAMLAQSDSLLYEAKHGGRDKVLSSGSTGRKGSVIWEGSQVQGALHDGRVVPVFQTIVNLRSGAIVADEALARIRAKDNSLIPAINFIQAAEALHLVTSIDKTISSGAIDRNARGLKNGTIDAGRAHFINLSHQFLANGEQVEALLETARTFQSACAINDTPAKPMVIEITERQGGDIMTLKKNLQPLTDFGFQLALDDFGSGYSSFLYLAELPVDYLKIEGWMVSRINRSKRVRQLVETLVSTAQKFKITTIAECVEDAQTAQVLCDMGVDWAQGYYFAMPLPEEVDRPA